MKTAKQHNAGLVGEYEFRHATVVRDGYRVPLLVIPPTAGLQECDLCHHEFPLAEVELVGSQVLCKKCRAADLPIIGPSGGIKAGTHKLKNEIH